MPIAVEIVHLPSSEAFRKDHAIFDPVLEFVASANGNLGAYYGFLEEDSNEAYMIVVWETVEHHYALMNDPEVYPRMLEAVKECVVGPVKLYHALLEPTSAVAVALNSPVASIDHIVELKAGVTREGMLAELSILFGAPPSDTPSTAFRGGCFGKVLENDELTVIRGRDSSLDLQAVDRGKVHIEEEYANLRAESVASGRTVHTKLSAYKTYQG